MTRTVSVKSYFARRSIRTCSECFAKKCLCCFDTAIFQEQKINDLALLVYRAIQVCHLPLLEMYVSSTRHELPTDRAKRCHCFSNSET